MSYRFVILVMADNTDEKKIVECCKNSSSKEYEFLTYLAEEFNIFTVVGPKAFASNIGFFPMIGNKKMDEIEEDEEDIEEPKINENEDIVN